MRNRQVARLLIGRITGLEVESLSVSPQKTVVRRAADGLEQHQPLTLLRMDFDVVIAGPIGTGKSHLAIALGVEAAKRRFRVLFVEAADLVRQPWKPGTPANRGGCNCGCVG